MVVRYINTYRGLSIMVMPTTHDGSNPRSNLGGPKESCLKSRCFASMLELVDRWFLSNHDVSRMGSSPIIRIINTSLTL